MFHCQSELLRYTKKWLQEKKVTVFSAPPLPPVPWGQHLFLLIEECDRYVSVLPDVFNKKRGGLVLPAEIFFYLFQFTLWRRSFEHFRLSDSNCDWTLKAAGVRNWKKPLILSVHRTIELKAKRNGLLVASFLSVSNILLPSSHFQPTLKSAFSVPHGISGAEVQFQIMERVGGPGSWFSRWLNHSCSLCPTWSHAGRSFPSSLYRGSDNPILPQIYWRNSLSSENPSYSVYDM